MAKSKPAKAKKAAAPAKKAAPAAKKAAKPAKPAKKAGVVSALVKTGSKLISKVTGKAEASKPAKAAAPVKTVQPKASKVKPEKKGKEKKAKAEDSDDLFLDDGVEAEDIPELEEFDEDAGPDDEDAALEAAANVESAPSDPDEIILTDAEGRRYCRVRDCDQVSAVEGYCRYHYLLLWKKIQVRRKILTEGKLDRYVDELTSRYPDKFLEMIKKDLRTEKDFISAIAELEIDESLNESDFEDDTQYIEEVRGLSSEPTMSDDDDGF